MIPFTSTPRIQLRRRMPGTGTFPNPRWTLPGSDPATELPAGAEERIREVGDVSRIYIVICINHFKVIYFLFMPFWAFVFCTISLQTSTILLCCGQCIDIFMPTWEYLISCVQNCFVCLIQFWSARAATYIGSLKSNFLLRTQPFWILQVYLCHSEKDQVQLNHYSL